MNEIRNMARVYRNMKTHHIEENLRRKKARLFALRNKHMTYLNKQEIVRMEYHIHQMEVELRCRADQLNML